MNSILVETLSEKFANQFEIISDDIGSFVRFPAKNIDFGDIIIYEEKEEREEYQGSYMIEIGKITHGHFCIREETINENVKEIAAFLENLFADRIICYNKGWCLRSEFEDDKDLIPGDLFVWSGIYEW